MPSPTGRAEALCKAHATICPWAECLAHSLQTSPGARRDPNEPDAGTTRHRARGARCADERLVRRRLSVKDDVTADNVSMIAAGAAFFGLLALFPALVHAAAAVAVRPESCTQSRQHSGTRRPCATI